MKKFTSILFVLTVAMGYNASAQVSAGLDLGFPTGNFSDIAGTGFGGSLRYEKKIDSHSSWTASAGFLSFGGKTYNVGNVSIPFGNTTNLALTGGAKYYFTEAGKEFYFALDLSLNFLSTYAYTINNGNGTGYNYASESATKVGFNPGIGYRLPTWDFSARYNGVGDFSYFGIRVAYVFPTK